MKLAIVFPGQGSQSVGMLRGFAESPEAVQALLEAKEVLGEAFVRLLEEGPSEALNLTVNTQPAMLTAGYAAYRAWLKREPGCDLPLKCLRIDSVDCQAIAADRAAQLFGRSDGHDSAAIENRQPVAALGLLHQMRGDKHRDFRLPAQLPKV